MKTLKRGSSLLLSGISVEWQERWGSLMEAVAGLESAGATVRIMLGPNWEPMSRVRGPFVGMERRPVSISLPYDLEMEVNRAGSPDGGQVFCIRRAESARRLVSALKDGDGRLCPYEPGEG